jgi:hypothetical protein
LLYSLSAYCSLQQVAYLISFPSFEFK